MGGEAAVRGAFERQAGWCRELGSPFTTVLMDAAAARLDRSTALGRRLLDWAEPPDEAFGALPLRFAGGLHALVRRGRLPALAALYPPAALPEADALWPRVAEAMAEAGAELDPWLDHPPQTNEVARSAALMAGCMVVTARFGLPLALFELGASAGLNLLLDRFAFRLGPVAAGVADSPVRLAPEWRGPPPPDAAPTVVRRRGVDLRPLDATREADRERLRAFVWADQAARLERLDGALALARQEPPRVDRADAADWLEANLLAEPEPGVARVVTHTIAAQYFPEAVRERVRARLEAVGARATAAAPLAWLRLEVEPGSAGPVLRLTTWPGEERVLGRGSAHGLWVEWAGEDARPGTGEGARPGTG